MIMVSHEVRQLPATVRHMLRRVKTGALYLGLGLLFTHELDAMPNHEWRVLPPLSLLSDSLGEIVFLVAHIPLFAVVVALVASLDNNIRTRAQVIFCVFLIIHSLLHYASSGNAAYEFRSLISSGLIYGAGLCGLSYILAYYFERKANAA